MNKRYFGMLAAALSAIIFGIAPILASLAYAHGSNSVVISCFRPLLSLPILAVIMAVKRVSFRLTGREALMLVITGVAGSGATSMLLYGSYSLIPVGMATAIHFIYPALVALASCVFFKTRLPALKIAAVAFSVAGAALFFTGGGMSLAGILLALLSGVSYTFFIMMVERSCLKGLDVFKRTFYICFVGALTAAVFGIATGNFDVAAMDGVAWGITAIISVMVTVGAFVLFQVGITLSGAPTAAILSTLEPIVGVALGFIVLNEQLTAFKLAACALIIAAVLLVGLAERRHADSGSVKEEANAEP